MRLSASFRRLVAFAVIISMVLTGCASRPYYVAPDLPDDLPRVRGGWRRLHAMDFRK